ADLVLLNIEGAIGQGRSDQKCAKKAENCYAFRMPSKSAAALRRIADSSVAMVGNVANNHARDAGDDGRDSTVAYLTAAGIQPTGYDSIATPVALQSGDTIAILGFYTEGLGPNALDLAMVKRLTERAVEQYGTV